MTAPVDMRSTLDELGDIAGRAETRDVYQWLGRAEALAGILTREIRSRRTIGEDE